MATMVRVNGKKILSRVPAGSETKPETRTSIVERLLGKPMAQIGKNEMTALVIAQYGACQNLMEALATENPNHPIIRGLVPRQSRWQLIFKRIKSILKQ
jgi:hypothetical protein